MQIGRELKWARRMVNLAVHISSYSKDPSSKIGAVITRPNWTVVSMGFNGFAQGVPDDPELYANRDYKIANVLHAEENAILTAREPLEGYTIAVSGLQPCASCCAKIIQSGIKRVIATKGEQPERWRQNIEWGRKNLIAAGVKLILLDKDEGERAEIYTLDPNTPDHPAMHGFPTLQ